MHSNEYNLESTATGAVEMMAENSLTFLPLDDPKKEVSLSYLQYYYSFFFIFIVRLHKISSREGMMGLI